MFARLFGKAFGSIRNNAAIAIAVIALFIAMGSTAVAVNTVRSTDIVNGQVKTVDLGNGAVTGAKTKGFNIRTFTNDQPTYTCAQVNIWSECAPVNISVPPGRGVIVNVWSSISADPGTTTMHALYCAAGNGPTCLLGGPDFATFFARGVGSASQTASTYVVGGEHRYSTAIKVPFALLAEPNAHVTTTVLIADVSLQTAN